MTRPIKLVRTKQQTLKYRENVVVIIENMIYKDTKTQSNTQLSWSDFSNITYKFSTQHNVLVKNDRNYTQKVQLKHKINNRFYDK